MKKFLTDIHQHTLSLSPLASVIILSTIFWGCSSSRTTKDNLVSLFSPNQSAEIPDYSRENPRESLRNADTLQNANTLQKEGLELKASAQSGNYVIRQGDQITIRVPGYSEFDTTATVGESGTIFMKLIGEINAAGITRSQFIEQLSSKLALYINTKFDLIVNIVDRSIQSVVILGEVTRQGNYQITDKMSLLQVIALAGGVTTEADVQHIRIMREGNPRNAFEIDISQYLEEGKPIIIPIPTIKTGDIVFVPREENLVRELSNFFREAIFLFGFFAVAQ